MIQSITLDQVTAHLEKYHTNTLWRLDTTKANSAKPNLIIDEPRFMPGTTNVYHGARLAVRGSSERLAKKSGDWVSEHISDLAHEIVLLRQRGYIADFTCGVVLTLRSIHSYLGEPCPDHANDDGLEF